MAKKYVSEQEQKNKALIAITKKNRHMYDYEKTEDFAIALGMHVRTMQRRLADPNTLSRQEQARLFEVLRFTPEERAACV